MISEINISVVLIITSNLFNWKGQGANFYIQILKNTYYEKENYRFYDSTSWIVDN